MSRKAKKNIIAEDKWWWENEKGIEVVTRHSENHEEYGEIDCHLITQITWDELLAAHRRQAQSTVLVANSNVLAANSPSGVSTNEKGK